MGNAEIAEIQLEKVDEVLLDAGEDIQKKDLYDYLQDCKTREESREVIKRFCKYNEICPKQLKLTNAEKLLIASLK